MKKNINNNKIDYLEIYRQAHNNAIGLLQESKLLFDNKYYPRAYFLAYTALEEISKSQHAADVYTGFSKEEDFIKSFAHHRRKIKRVTWAYLDANSSFYNQVWLGPNIDDVEKIAPAKPLWKKRLDSLYVGINSDKIRFPANKIRRNDALGIIHIVETALHQIWDMVENWGHQIGTKGFMK
ncbi:MAG: AbiV family abortive infection protein [Nanoarchaeota archaeon]|nr:AbiV family abortive infection protein [Nanoarchaeota archaeon]